MYLFERERERTWARREGGPKGEGKADTQPLSHPDIPGSFLLMAKSEDIRCHGHMAADIAINTMCPDLQIGYIIFF